MRILACISGLGLLLVSCSKDVVDEGDVAVEEVEKNEEVMILAPEVWRTTGTFFRAYLGEIDLGWDKAKVLEYAGDPDGVREGDWVYRWQKTPTRGGEYREFMFGFEGERLVSKDSVGGFLPRRY